MGGTERCRGAEEHCAGDPAGEGARTEHLAGVVDADGGGALAVDVGVDDRLPVVREVVGKFPEHLGGVQRDAAGQDERAGVAGGPQGVDDLAHQAQHPAGALELLQRRPVVVEPVEQLRVDGVGGLEPVLVLAALHVAGELAVVLAVEADELPGHGRDVGACGGVGLLEQAASHDLERLDRGRRSPVVGGTSDHVLQLLKRSLPVGAADLQRGSGALLTG